VKIAKIFIDLDGPILDSADRYYYAYLEALKKLGVTAINKELYWNLKRSKTLEVDILKLSSAERYIDKYIKIRNSLIENKELLAYDTVWPELKEIYMKLFARIPTVLVTLRASVQRTHWQLKQLGIYSWFKQIYTLPKPYVSKEHWKIKADIVAESDMLAEINANSCIFIGDTEADIMAGKHLKMKTLAVSFGIRDKCMLLEVKPDILVQTREELVNFLKKEIL